MDETKHKTIPFKDTINVREIIGEQVLTSAGKKLGKVKSVHIHPKDLTVEGILMDPGMFTVDQYFDAGYIETLNLEGVVLKIEPIDEIVGNDVFDNDGKMVGKVTGINKSKRTNTLLSIIVDLEESDMEVVIAAEYIAAVSEKTLMLKEPFDLEDHKEK